MVYQAAGMPEGAELYETDEAVLKETAALFRPEAFLPMLRALHDALTELRWTTEPRIAVETALLSVCREGGAPTASDRSAAPAPGGNRLPEAALRILAARMDAIEKKIASASPAGTTASRRFGAGAKKSSAAARRPARKSAEPQEAFVKTEEGEALWNRLLAALKEAGEEVVLTCLEKNGAFGGMTEHSFCVRFVNHFAAERLEEEDYREVVEEFLERLSGKPLRIVAEEEKAKEEPQKEKGEEETPEEENLLAQMMEELSPQERDFLREIFGSDMQVTIKDDGDDGDDGETPSGGRPPGNA